MKSLVKMRSSIEIKNRYMGLMGLMSFIHSDIDGIEYMPMFQKFLTPKELHLVQSNHVMNLEAIEQANKSICMAVLLWSLNLVDKINYLETSKEVQIAHQNFINQVNAKTEFKVRTEVEITKQLSKIKSNNLYSQYQKFTLEWLSNYKNLEWDEITIQQNLQ
jgi:Domain of unknown function (DUF4272)